MVAKVHQAGSRSKNKLRLLALMAAIAIAFGMVELSYAAVSFTFADFFAIPALNSTINFAYSGSYDSATFEDNFWAFGGLTLSGSGSSVGKSHSLTMSAQDCNVTITHLDTLKWLDQVGWLTYNVKGEGNQTFNMHWRAEGFVIKFKVYIDGVERAKNDGWTGYFESMTENGIIITGAKSNASIGYAFNPETIGPEPNFPSPNLTPTTAPVSNPSTTPNNSTLPLLSPSISPTLTPTTTLESEINQTSDYVTTTVLIFAVLLVPIVFSIAIAIIKWNYKKQKKLTL